MQKSDYLARKTETIEVRQRSISQLLEAMANTGFQGKSLGKAAQVLRSMIAEPDNTIILGYAGSMSTTGQWKIIKWLIENRFVDVLVSTGANITEDVFEAMGFSYYQGSALVDDADLLEKQIDRYYDVYADEMQYRQMEYLLGEFINSLPADKPYSSADFLREFGRFQDARGIDSITTAAYRHGVPVFSPAMADSGFGVAAVRSRPKGGQRAVVDQFRDFDQLADIGQKTGNTSVIYIGGGVPKDTIQLIAVMIDLVRGGEEVYPHKYAVQITTDSPQWGGLSGCTFEEAISWGKISENEADRAVVYSDATIALPILAHALLESGVKRADPPSYDWLFAENAKSRA